MHNDGKGNFVDIAGRAGPYFHQEHVGRGATYGDLDNDGDLDVVVINLNDAPAILRNDGGNRNRWLKLDLRGPGGKSPALGSRIEVKARGLLQTQLLMPMTGYLSQCDPRPHFGVGSVQQVDSVTVRWPDGQRTELRDVATNQILQLIQDAKK